jgi:hypothetical protein
MRHYATSPQRNSRASLKETKAWFPLQLRYNVRAHAPKLGACETNFT